MSGVLWQQKKRFFNSHFRICSDIQSFRFISEHIQFSARDFPYFLHKTSRN
nr:MAG TPA: hypothetical protein [Caudoviricetes sp.]